jgi:DNA polymerase III subunit epsilon
MGKRFRFALVLGGVFALVVGVSAAVAAGIWSQLDESERAAVRPVIVANEALVVAGALALLFALGFLVRIFFELYLTPPLKLAERARIILRANPSHRLEASGGREVRELAQVINAFAETNQALQRDVAARIKEAQGKLEDERNRLAALISELTECVLVCNMEGRILLYNQRAQQLLGERHGEAASSAGAALVGLGRSIFAVIERSMISHALESIEYGLQQGDGSPAARFVITAPGGQLVRVNMTPVLSDGVDGGAQHTPGERGITGFVLIMEDVTEAVVTGSRKDVFFQSLTEDSRRALANMRAAAETLLGYPAMEPENQSQFIRVIGDEAAALSARLDQAAGEYAASLSAEWLLEEMLGADLLSAACRRITTRLGIHATLDKVDPSLWIKLDSYSLLQGLTYLARRLRDERGVRELRFRLVGAGRLAHLDLIWDGAAAKADALPDWDSRPLNTGGEASPLTLKEVLARHDGEILYRADWSALTAFFRLLLPATEPRRAMFRGRRVEAGRPEYYDFDLFHQAGQTPALDDHKLTELVYTVFDTEATGLEPSRGDEIVSIGAVRIVNGRLLHHESFEQLVDPRKPMSTEAVRITGIDASMLEGQPTIDQVLPQFHRFCEDTVLVAHNAAFDMRLLQIKEQAGGVRFTQPVLDTLLLAAVLHPNLETIRLEAIAELFGINVIGRHTALGDAMMTGEVFLKMIPLLSGKGITTLKEAREASQKTYYARIRY